MPQTAPSTPKHIIHKYIIDEGYFIREILISNGDMQMILCHDWDNYELNVHFYAVQYNRMTDPHKYTQILKLIQRVVDIDDRCIIYERIVLECDEHDEWQ